MNDHNHPEHLVAQRLRLLRDAKGLSLRALAEKSGLSFNAISRIERGENSPTVATLHLLAQGLGVSVTAFFEDSSEAAVVFTKQDRRIRSTVNGITLESLGIGLHDQQLAPFAAVIEPGAGSHQSPITHAGEEFVYCLEGCLTYKVSEQVYELAAGDSLLFDAAQPHCFCNRSALPARFLLIFYGVDSRQQTVEQHHLLPDDD
jgi:transcriptional regulator with XRE-family HTH domain